MSEQQMNKRKRSVFGWAFFYMMLFPASQIVMTIIIVIALIIFFIATGQGMPSGGELVVTTLPWVLLTASILTVAVACLIARLRKISIRKQAMLNPAAPITIIASLFMGVSVSIVFATFFSFSIFEFLEGGTTSEMQQMLTGSLAISIIASLITPIAEDITFRGFALNELRRGFLIIPSIIISSIIFGIIHMAPFQVFYTAIGGLGLCWMTLRTRSLYTGLAAHIGLNGTSFVLLELSSDADSFSNTYFDIIGTVGHLPLILGGLLVLFICTILLIRNSQPMSTIEPAPEPARKSAPQPYPYPYAAPTPMPAVGYYPPAPGAFSQADAFPQVGAFPQQGQPYQQQSYPYQDQIPNYPTYPQQNTCPQNCPHYVHCMQYGCPQPQQQAQPNPQVQPQDINYSQGNQEDRR